MFTDLASIRSAVNERLTPELPAGWKVEDSIEGTIKALVPVLYLEFTAVSTTLPNGDALGHGQVSASFNLIITDPKTDTKKAEASVDEHLVKVLTTLDSFDDIFWTTGSKSRMPDGPLAWSINAFAIASTQPTEQD